MKLRYLALVGMLALAACATAAVKQQTSVFELRSSYAIYLDAAAAYAQLPFCAKGTAPTVAAPCSDPHAVIALKKADDAAKIALDSAETVVRDNPVVDASSAIAAAQKAFDAVKAIEIAYNIKTGA